jgi:hypothetical protein
MSLVSSNWAKLQAKQQRSGEAKKKPAPAVAAVPSVLLPTAAAPAHKKGQKRKADAGGAAAAASAAPAAPELTSHIAMDCEMVGVGRDGMCDGIRVCVRRLNTQPVCLFVARCVWRGVRQPKCVGALFDREL